MPIDVPCYAFAGVIAVGLEHIKEQSDAEVDKTSPFAVETGRNRIAQGSCAVVLCCI
ncbi:hypothetical protein Q31a_29800 [Aureliella helgolandensis]|uniref:Uncharacterized protein n=1 Tax=Aureliella helgolandensis TaxID=2527968 RepID=A0A518G7U6_9BACT|nr:hypothetical protein Q31a_29800 [Aureliella helgolandensis]